MGVSSVIGEGVCPDKPSDGATYGKVRLPNFKVEAVFTSQRPRANSDVTIVTQCSVDRWLAETLRLQNCT